MNMAQVERLRAFAATVEDVVFRRSVTQIADALELSVKFRRIDMAFLQMRGAGGVPKFALIEYERFKAGEPCVLDQSGYQMQDGSLRFGELFRRGDFFSQVTATPKVNVPESVDATVTEECEKFDEVLVAWEADWQPGAKDPIVIGRLGAYYYVVATWDMTELESFVADAFAEKHDAAAAKEV